MSDLFRDDDVFIGVGVGRRELNVYEVRQIFRELYPNSEYSEILVRKWMRTRGRNNARPPHDRRSATRKDAMPSELVQKPEETSTTAAVDGTEPSQTAQEVAENAVEVENETSGLKPGVAPAQPESTEACHTVKIGNETFGSKPGSTEPSQTVQEVENTVEVENETSRLKPADRDPAASRRPEDVKTSQSVKKIENETSCSKPDRDPAASSRPEDVETSQTVNKTENETSCSKPGDGEPSETVQVVENTAEVENETSRSKPDADPPASSRPEDAEASQNDDAVHDYRLVDSNPRLSQFNPRLSESVAGPARAQPSRRGRSEPRRPGKPASTSVHRAVDLERADQGQRSRPRQRGRRQIRLPPLDVSAATGDAEQRQKPSNDQGRGGSMASGPILTGDPILENNIAQIRIPPLDLSAAGDAEQHQKPSSNQSRGGNMASGPARPIGSALENDIVAHVPVLENNIAQIRLPALDFCAAGDAEQRQKPSWKQANTPAGGSPGRDTGRRRDSDRRSQGTDLSSNRRSREASKSRKPSQDDARFSRDPTPVKTDENDNIITDIPALEKDIITDASALENDISENPTLEKKTDIPALEKDIISDIPALENDIITEIPTLQNKTYIGAPENSIVTDTVTLKNDIVCEIPTLEKKTAGIASLEKDIITDIAALENADDANVVTARSTKDTARTRSRGKSVASSRSEKNVKQNVKMKTKIERQVSIGPLCKKNFF